MDGRAGQATRQGARGEQGYVHLVRRQNRGKLVMTMRLGNVLIDMNRRAFRHLENLSQLSEGDFRTSSFYENTS